MSEDAVVAAITVAFAVWQLQQSDASQEVANCGKLVQWNLLAFLVRAKSPQRP
jgi:hypothetical protein